MAHIAIFASGNGTNAERIAKYFSDSEIITVNMILTNNPDAGVIKRANNLGIETIVFNKHEFYKTNKIVSILEDNKIDFIVLAGFLWLVPENLLLKYENRIINIHPALLPKYGGKGMYGMNVHKAVIESGDSMSGITIHMVNDKYDEGQIIFQANVNVTKDDTPDTLAAKIHKLEYQHFPVIISEIVLKA